MWRKIGRTLLSAASKLKGIRENVTTGETRGFLLPFCDSVCSPFSFSSEDGAITVVLGSASRLTYSVLYNGKPVISDSRISLITRGLDLCEDVLVAVPSVKRSVTQYPERAKKAVAVDAHTSYSFPVRNRRTGLQFILEFRLWRDGVGFRLRFSENTRLLVDDERTQFNVNPASVCFYQTDPVKLQGVTHRCPSSELPAHVDFSCLTMFDITDVCYLMLTESDLTDYAGCALKSLGNGSFVTDLWDSGSFYAKGLTAPWRLMLISDSLNDFYNCDIIKNTAQPESSVFTDKSWITPGIATWSYFVDRPVSRDFDTIMSFTEETARLGAGNTVIDSGWRKWGLTEGAAFKKAGEVCKKARGEGVAVWVWKSSVTGPYLSCFRNRFFKRCKKYGVSGVKLDHLESETQLAVNLYRSFLHDAAKHGILVSYHNPNKPTGLSRTYPNLLTREAVRGLQTYCMPDDNVILPFTRFVADGAVYTPFCFSDDARQGGATISHMLATAVIFNSALLTIAEHPRNLRSHEMKDFLLSVPPVWDETLVLEPSAPGELAVFARRRGDNWYLAALNGSTQPRELTLTLSFLRQGTEYKAESFGDIPDEPKLSRRENSVVRSSESASVTLLCGGGFVAVYLPVLKEVVEP